MGELRAFHRIVARLDYPMIVVTAVAGDERSGCLVGFHTQCSIDPARYLVCISMANHTAPVAARADQLVVHVLDRAERPLAELFGEETGDAVDKFDRCAWHEHDGAIVLDDARAWFRGRVLERVPFGDHTGHLLEPVDGALDGELHQLSFQQVKRLDPGHPA